jgi:predicted AAA+ superfamily ATPase
VSACRRARWAATCSTRPTADSYQRDRENIDFIIENNAGEIAAIEVKASATIDRRNRRWLEHLRDARASSFKAGVVIHSGPQTIPLGDRLCGMPFSGLWA